MPNMAAKEPKIGLPIKRGRTGAFLLLLKRVQSDMRVAYAVLDPAAAVIAYNIAHDLAVAERGFPEVRSLPGEPRLALIAQPKSPKNTTATTQAAGHTNLRILDGWISSNRKNTTL